MHRNESYSIHQLTNQLHNVTTPTTIYSSLVDPYDDIILLPERVDAIGLSHRDLSTQPVQVANPRATPVREEASRNGVDFYDTEEHTYSVVNKKKAKKTLENGEGEREKPPDYEMGAVPGETLQGVTEEHMHSTN